MPWNLLKRRRSAPHPVTARSPWGRRYFALRLELLEDRTTPSALLSLFELDGNAATGVLASPPGANGSSTTTSHDWDQVFADAG